MFLKALSPHTVISGARASISEFGLTYNLVHDNRQLWVFRACSLPIQFCCWSIPHHVRLFVTPWTSAHQGSLSFTISQSLLKLLSMSTESVMPSNHLILCRPILLLPSIFPSIRVFSNESVLHMRWPKYWSFSFGISPSNEYLGLIYFRIDWFDLLVVQGNLKSSSPSPQFKSINSLVLSLL